MESSASSPLPYRVCVETKTAIVTTSSRGRENLERHGPQIEDGVRGFWISLSDEAADWVFLFAERNLKIDAKKGSKNTPFHPFLPIFPLKNTFLHPLFFPFPKTFFLSATKWFFINRPKESTQKATFWGYEIGRFVRGYFGFFKKIVRACASWLHLRVVLPQNGHRLV
jgi:hypothetical protein